MTNTMKQQHKNYRTRLFLVALLCGSVFYTVFAQAAEESIANLSKQKLEDKYAQLTAQIKAAKQILALKEHQGSTLTDQIQSLEAQANKLELEIGLNKK